MGCCATKPSDDDDYSAATGIPASSHHPAAARHKRNPANATVSPLTSHEGGEEFLSEWSTVAPKPPAMPPSSGRNYSIAAAVNKKVKKNSPAATSFSFDKKDGGRAEGNQATPLASDVWSITNSFIAPPTPNRGFGATTIELSSEVWSLADSTLFPPMPSPAIRRPGPFTPARNSHAPRIEMDTYSTVMSPIRGESEVSGNPNAYGSTGGRRREKEGPYLAGKQRRSPPSPVVIAPPKREREMRRNSSYAISGEMRRWKDADEQKEEYSRRSAAAAVVKEDGGVRKMSGGGGVAANESSDGSLSIEGFVFM